MTKPPWPKGKVHSSTECSNIAAVGAVAAKVIQTMYGRPIHPFLCLTTALYSFTQAPELIAGSLIWMWKHKEKVWELFQEQGVKITREQFDGMLPLEKCTEKLNTHSCPMCRAFNIIHFYIHTDASGEECVELARKHDESLPEEQTDTVQHEHLDDMVKEAMHREGPDEDEDEDGWSTAE